MDIVNNVPASEAETATIATWYYYRWRIESFFKLLKSAGYELEYWRQETGKGIINRLLIASMACVYVWQLQQDKSQEAAILRSHLMKLSGRRTKYGVESTVAALLAGWYSMMAMLQLLESETSVNQLRKLAKMYAPP